MQSKKKKNIPTELLIKKLAAPLASFMLVTFFVGMLDLASKT